MAGVLSPATVPCSDLACSLWAMYSTISAVVLSVLSSPSALFFWQVYNNNNNNILLLFMYTHFVHEKKIFLSFSPWDQEKKIFLSFSPWDHEKKIFLSFSRWDHEIIYLTTWCSWWNLPVLELHGKLEEKQPAYLIDGRGPKYFGKCEMTSTF